MHIKQTWLSIYFNIPAMHERTHTFLPCPAPINIPFASQRLVNTVTLETLRNSSCCHWKKKTASRFQKISESICRTRYYRNYSVANTDFNYYLKSGRNTFLPTLYQTSFIVAIVSNRSVKCLLSQHLLGTYLALKWLKHCIIYWGLLRISAASKYCICPKDSLRNLS
jgi:hypothetical protein